MSIINTFNSRSGKRLVTSRSNKQFYYKQPSQRQMNESYIVLITLIKYYTWGETIIKKDFLSSIYFVCINSKL